MVGQAVTIEKNSGRPTNIQARREAQDLEFLGKFGHKHDSAGYQGHPFYGYNCRAWQLIAADPSKVSAVPSEATSSESQTCSVAT